MIDLKISNQKNQFEQANLFWHKQPFFFLMLLLLFCSLGWFTI